MIDAPTQRPSVEDRRQQIREAAAVCFRRSGFHGASMAEIAKEANLSVGQIYRYFENKEAIIEAIVEHDIAEKRAKFDEFYATEGDFSRYMVETCSQAVERFWDPARAALDLEVMAEAARNPKVAEILRRREEAEKQFKGPFSERIRRPGWTAEEAEQRGELIGMMFDGMAMHSISYPDRCPNELAQALRKVLAAILEVPDIDGPDSGTKTPDA